MANPLQFARRRRFPSPLQSVDSPVGPVKPSDSEITSDDLNVDDPEDTSRFYDKENENPDVQKLRDLTINAPKLEDYLPGTGRKVGNSIAAALTAFGSKSPALGIKLGDELNEKGVDRAKEQFGQDLTAANDVTRASQTSASLAQKDEAQQQDTESTNANLEERAKEHADMLGLHYDQLTRQQRHDLAQQMNWLDERKRDQQRLGIEQGNLDVRRDEAKGGGKPTIQDVVDQDPDSPTFGKTIKTSIRPGDIKPGMMSKLTGNEEGNLDTLNAVMGGTKSLANLLNDPEVIADMGVAKGKKQSMAEWFGTSANPKTQEANKQLQLLADIHAKALVARGGQQLMKHLESTLGRTDMDIPMIKANLTAMAKNATDMGEGIIPGFAKRYSSHPLLSQATSGDQYFRSPSTGKRYVKHSNGQIEEAQ